MISAVPSYFGCKVDADCFSANLKELIETYARKDLYEKSYVSGTEELEGECKTAA